MIKTIKVTNYVGDTLTIDMANPYNSGLAIENIDGIASLDATINTVDVATNDGTVFNSSRVNSRSITFTIKPIYTTTQTIEQGRLLIYKYFPVKKKLTLEFTTDTRHVLIEGYVESSEAEVFSESETVAVTIECPQPFFENPYSETVAFSGIESRLEFPFGGTDTSTPNTKDAIIISEIMNDTVRDVPYNGDVETGMIINIHAIGEASDIVIYNLSTNETMGISGTIEALDDIVISTIRNKKSARLLRHGVYTNILNKLAKDSDWFELQKGSNIIAYTAETGQDNLQFSVTTTVLYEGI